MTKSFEQNLKYSITRGKNSIETIHQFEQEIDDVIMHDNNAIGVGVDKKSLYNLSNFTQISRLPKEIGDVLIVNDVPILCSSDSRSFYKIDGKETFTSSANLNSIITVGKEFAICGAMCQKHVELYDIINGEHVGQINNNYLDMLNSKISFTLKNNESVINTYPAIVAPSIMRMFDTALTKPRKKSTDYFNTLTKNYERIIVDEKYLILDVDNKTIYDERTRRLEHKFRKPIHFIYGGNQQLAYEQDGWNIYDMHTFNKAFSTKRRCRNFLSKRYSHIFGIKNSIVGLLRQDNRSVEKILEYTITED
ncbi:MAG: hypothetical protein ACP5NV_03635 [Candidatus Woesearchaeota archaeon]